MQIKKYAVGYQMKIHFVAVGGSVMHQLAIALKRKGYQVTGSDDEIFEPARSNLAAAGILPASIGWHPELITPDLDAVILGMHARADNPELLKAQELGVKIYSFPEYIYQESRDKKRVVVGGSHGKTTTTAMLMHVLRQLHRDFDYMVGARLEGFDQSVNITYAPLIVCEGDEYLASTLNPHPKFHFLFPHIAIITGIAWDHINVFPTFEIYLEQFRIFIDRIEKDGILIYNASDPQLKSLVDGHLRSDIRYQSYGIPQHEIRNGITYVTVEGVEEPLEIFGDHNLLNMNAAWYACKELGLTARQFLDAIASFKGASKRLELIAKNACANAYRDFAHAPSKVRATIQAVKNQFPGRKLIGVLELHTYSSLNEAFLPQYKGTLDPADEAVVFYAKHALQIKHMPDLPKERIEEGFGKKGLRVMTDRKELEQWLRAQSYDNADLLLMSSGNYDGLDIVSLAKELIHE